MRSSMLCTTTLLLFAVTCGSPRTSTRCEAMKPEDALEEVRQTYVEAFNAGDADSVAALHTEDAVYMPAGMQAVHGRAAIRELVESSLSRMPSDVRFDFTPREVRMAEGWAVERGVTPASDIFPSGKYAMLYERKSDGCWRIAWAITNSDAPPGSSDDSGGRPDRP